MLVGSVLSRFDFVLKDFLLIKFRELLPRFGSPKEWLVLYLPKAPPPWVPLFFYGRGRLVLAWPTYLGLLALICPGGNKGGFCAVHVSRKFLGSSCGLTTLGACCMLLF